MRPGAYGGHCQDGLEGHAKPAALHSCLCRRQNALGKVMKAVMSSCPPTGGEGLILFAKAQNGVLQGGTMPKEQHLSASYAGWGWLWAGAGHLRLVESRLGRPEIEAV